MQKPYTKTKLDAIIRSDKTVNSFLLCLFFGFLGMHSFYNRRVNRGLLQLFTLGGGLIWCFIDLYLLLSEKFTDKEGNILCWGKGLSKSYAGFKIRLCASTIDFILMTIILLVCNVFEIPVLNQNLIIITALYYTITTASPLQATIGKRLVGIYVITKSGKRLNLIQSFARFICYFLSNATFFIGFFMSGWTINKTALQDMIMGTCVIYGKPKPVAKSSKKSLYKNILKLAFSKKFPEEELQSLLS
jgi:uncharacterized RDD family membrane protein YckC/TM2 domain-containing membrane protein YozV